MMTIAIALFACVCLVCLAVALVRLDEIKELIAEQPTAPSCDHKWKTIHERDVYVEGVDEGAPNARPIHQDYILQCEHCGDIKMVRT